MEIEQDGAERRLSRQDLLKWAAVAGGAGMLAGRAGIADAMRAFDVAESGRLQVMDWAGYGNDGGQAMFAQYVKQYPNNKPQFTYMTNESDALAKLHAGLKVDIFRPYVGWTKYFATSGLVQPWDTSKIPNFKYLNPAMVKAGQYNGKQYGIPEDWGFDAILYRTDKVKPKSQLVGTAVRRALQGQDRLVRRPRHDRHDRPLPRRQGSVEPDVRRAEEDAAVPHLEEAPRPPDLVVGDEPLGGLRLRRPLDRVRVAERLGADEEEGPAGRLHAPEGEADRVGRDDDAPERARRAPDLAHAYVNAWSSIPSATWLENNYGYGHANTKARPTSVDLVKALQLNNPKAVDLPNAYLDRDIPQRALYAKMWEEVKAS